MLNDVINNNIKFDSCNDKFILLPIINIIYLLINYIHNIKKNIKNKKYMKMKIYYFLELLYY